MGLVTPPLLKRVLRNVANMISLEDYSDLISAIQSAAIEPDKWDLAIQKLVTAMNGSGAHFITLDKFDGSLIAQRTVNFDETVAKNYGEHYHEISPRTKFLMEYDGRVCFDEMFIDEDQRKKDEFYNWTSSFDAQYFIGAHSLGDRDTFSGIGIFRGGNAGHVQSNEIDVLNKVWPHLQSALNISRKLTGSTLHLEELAGSLEMLGKAAIIIGADRQVVALNTLAEECFNQSELLTIQNRTVEVQGFENRSKLEHALSHALQRSDGLLVGNFNDTINIISANGVQEFRLTLQPLKSTDVFMGRNVPCAMIILSDMVRETETNKHILKNQFQLTNAEADICIEIYDGHSLNLIAQKRKTSIHTVRNQAKVIFDKTATNSQAQLVAMLANTIREF